MSSPTLAIIDSKLFATCSIEYYNEAINEISNKDSLFNAWINQQFLPSDASALPTQIKCRNYITEVVLNQQVDKLFAIRNKLIMDYLVNVKKTDPNRISITNTMDEKSAEFESTPRFTVDFNVDE